MPGRCGQIPPHPVLAARIRGAYRVSLNICSSPASEGTEFQATARRQSGSVSNTALCSGKAPQPSVEILKEAIEFPAQIF